jgi:hypothetical protein
MNQTKSTTHYIELCTTIAYLLEHPTDKCVLWQHSLMWKGYGQVWAKDQSGKLTTVRVHRLAFFLAYGLWPDHCLHSCDHPACFNPRHLRDGTQSENIQEAYDKDRMVDNRGERCGTAKLTEDIVREIRATTDLSFSQLARKFDIGLTTAFNIKHRRRWKHVA